MTERDFEFLRILLQLGSGLSLGPEKRYLLESRLGMLCHRRGIANLDALLNVLRRRTDPELETAVIEAMTTNETLFFRDRTPFDLFRNVLLPEKLAANAAQRRLRIWCAAVSTGQEAYSLAMILDEMADRLRGWTVEILGTDISGDVLDKAREGLYSQFEIQRGLPIQMLLKHFRQEGDKWRVAARLRAMVSFRQHNLLAHSGHFGEFDIVFCRNVLIYFDRQTRARVIAGLAPRLTAGGALILGAAETLLGLDTPLVADTAHSSIYRRAAPRAPLFPIAAQPAATFSPAPHR